MGDYRENNTIPLIKFYEETAWRLTALIFDVDDINNLHFKRYDFEGLIMMSSYLTGYEFKAILFKILPIDKSYAIKHFGWLNYYFFKKSALKKLRNNSIKRMVELGVAVDYGGLSYEKAQKLNSEKGLLIVPIKTYTSYENRYYNHLDAMFKDYIRYNK